CTDEPILAHLREPSPHVRGCWVIDLLLGKEAVEEGVGAMDEAAWLNCTDPRKMLKFLRDNASDRKLRLFAVACCRRIWSLLPDERSRKVVEVGEHYADGVVSEHELDVTVEAAATAAAAAINDLQADLNNESAFVIASGCFAALETAYNYGRRYVF